MNFHLIQEINIRNGIYSRKKKNVSEAYIHGRKKLKYGLSRTDKGFHLILENFNKRQCIWEWRKIKIEEIEGCEVSYKHVKI
jgi:hypothetical protein